MIELKCWPVAFGKIITKQRRIDCRIGLTLKARDEILYREFSPMTRIYSGREAKVIVGHVTKAEVQFDPLNEIALGMTIFNISDVSMMPPLAPTPEVEVTNS